MKFEEIQKAILGLSSEDRLRLMREVGPEWCESMVSSPDAMAQMMPRCREMMGRHPGMMVRMREMMSGMCGPMRGGPGKQG
jgi:hypothetical protein